MRINNLYPRLLQIAICLCVCVGLSAQTAKPTRTLARAGKVHVAFVMKAGVVYKNEAK